MSTLKIILLFCLSFVFLGCSVNTKPQTTNLTQSTVYYQAKVLSINSAELKVEVADTLDKKITGLSNRESMPQDTGMLFVFDKVDNYEFWMKDMKFGLDFIWLLDNKVVDLHENIPSPVGSSDEPVRIKAKELVNGVIEVNSGWINAQGVKIGDTVIGL